MNQTTSYLAEEIRNLDQTIIDHKTLAETETDIELKKLLVEEIEKLTTQKEALTQAIDTIANVGNAENGNTTTSNGVEINPNQAILEIRAGTGGDEAGLFAQDLYRMYARYGENNKWKMEELFRSENEAGGIKTITTEIRGRDVYALLRHESGVHRVQRVPVTESGGRIHTSTATIAVLPELKKVELEIKPDDLHWEFFRAGGNGGQNVNKVSTAVRLTHLPTGTIVECKEERFQGKNREKALSLLQSRIFTRMQEQNVQNIADLRSTQVGTADRSEKIRTYNYPQDRVTDHRVNQNWHNIEGMMEGDIGDMLETCKTLA